MAQKRPHDALEHDEWQRAVRPRLDAPPLLPLGPMPIGPILPQALSSMPLAIHMPIGPVAPALLPIGPVLPAGVGLPVAPSGEMEDEAAANPFLYQQQVAFQQEREREVLAKEKKRMLAAAAKEKRVFRQAAGEVWEDATLADWPKSDYRIFVGNLGNDVSDEVLRKSFSQYKSLAMVKVVRDKRTSSSRGYGFVSLLDPKDFVRAMKEMQGQYIQTRPCQLKKSDWQDRNLESGTRVRKGELRKSHHAKPYKKPPPRPIYQPPSAREAQGIIPGGPPPSGPF